MVSEISLFMILIAAAVVFAGDTGMYGSVTVRYYDNVFNLSDDARKDFEKRDPDYALSGRFSRMEYISDMVTIPEISMKLLKKTKLCRISASADAGYHDYSRNKECNYTDYCMKIVGKRKKNSGIEFELNYSDDRYLRNYLADCKDTNGNGNISSDERIYRAGYFNEFEAFLKYFTDYYAGELTLTTLSRTKVFNSLFENRNQKQNSAGISFRYPLMKKVYFETGCSLSRISSPENIVLVLLDENLYGDINKDAVIAPNAACFTSVSRAADRFDYFAGFRVKNGKFVFQVEFSGKSMSYLSENRLDIEHYNQKKTGEELHTALTYSPKEILEFSMEYKNKKEEDEEESHGQIISIQTMVRF